MQDIMLQRTYMVGMQRSGTNFLRVGLSAHENIFAPHPPHFLMEFSKIINIFGDLRIEKNIRRLIKAMCGFLYINPVPWECGKLDEDSIFKRIGDDYSLYGVYRAIYDEAASMLGKTHWVCKSVDNIIFAPELAARYQDDKFIFIMRDARDVVCSFKKAVIGPKTAYHIATKWKTASAIGISLMKDYPDRVLFIRYEDMLSRQENVYKKICDFMGLPFRKGMLKGYKTAEAQKAAQASSLWENLTKEPLKDNKGKYKNELSDYEINLVESIARDEMIILGYTPESNVCISISEEDIERFNQENAIKQKEIVERLKLENPQDFKNRERIRLYMESLKI